jgi:hypothetical protein
MKLAFVVLVLIAAPAWAQKIDRIQILSQQEFRLLSEDLGGALSYRGQTPAEPLGIIGFDIGVALTGARIKNVDVFERATSDSVDATIPVPTLRAHKGLPLGIDVGVMFSAVPGSDIRHYGGELRWALVRGDIATPAIGVRASMTRLSGVDQLGLDTRGLDLSMSKGFAMITPYAGLGRVWVESDPKGVSGLQREKFTLDKLFIGAGLNMGGSNINFEVDKTGDVSGLSIKAGIRF